MSQSKNNACVLVYGSLDLFSSWCLKSAVQKDGTKTRKPKSSIIKLDRQLNLASTVSVTIVEYSVEIYEWSGTSWKPYVADDVQLQFYMMESIYFENYVK